MRRPLRRPGRFSRHACCFSPNPTEVSHEANGYQVALVSFPGCSDHRLRLGRNLSWFRGKHTITFGTKVEYYDIANLFNGQNFGVYEYGSLDDFLAS